MKKIIQKRFTLEEVSEIARIDRSTVITFIQREWVIPVSSGELDEEDVARIHLIQDIQCRLGANDEAVPLILHLLDQLYYLRNRLRDFSADQEKRTRVEDP